MLEPEELEEKADDNEVSDASKEYELALSAMLLYVFSKSLDGSFTTSQGLNYINGEKNKLDSQLTNTNINVFENVIGSSIEIDNQNLGLDYEIDKETILRIGDSTDEILKNYTETTAFKDKPIRNYYLNQVDYYINQIDNGMIDLNSAVMKISNDMASQGLEVATYPDSKNNMNIASATRRNIITGLNQTNQKVTIDYLENNDIKLVEVTAHGGARPSHAKWQGGIYYYKIPVKGYRSLVSATGYGSVEGLGGPNCTHTFHVFVPELMEPLYTKERLANIDKTPREWKGELKTEWEMKKGQRYYEHNIRMYQRRKNNLSKLDLPTSAIDDKIKLWKNEYSSFSKAMGIREKTERLYNI